MYTSIFRTSHQLLAAGELEYAKSFGDPGSDKRLFFGMKIGIILFLVSSIFLDEHLYVVPGLQNNFWSSPGLYVFSSIGNIPIHI
jgi:hypothetical protein